MTTTFKKQIISGNALNPDSTYPYTKCKDIKQGYFCQINEKDGTIHTKRMRAGKWLDETREILRYRIDPEKYDNVSVYYRESKQKVYRSNIGYEKDGRNVHYWYSHGKLPLEDHAMIRDAEEGELPKFGTMDEVEGAMKDAGYIMVSGSIQCKNENESWENRKQENTFVWDFWHPEKQIGVIITAVNHRLTA